MFAEHGRGEVERIRALLADAGVAFEPEQAPSQADERILSAVLARADAGSAVAVEPRRPRRRTVLRAAVAATAVVGVVVGALAWQGGGTPAAAGTPALLHFADADVAQVLAGGGEPAGAVLTELAEVAATQPVTAGEGAQEVTSYGWYLSSTDTNGVKETVLSPTRQVVLLRPDGSLRIREERTAALDLEGRVIDGDLPPGGANSDESFPTGSLDPTRVAGLPRDPAALRDVLLADGESLGCGTSDSATAACLLRAVIESHSFEVVPADVASAFWAVLADQPDLVTMGSTTDRLGRRGTAVAVRIDEGERLLVIVISPDDGRLLEWDEILASAPHLGSDGPTVIGFKLFESARWLPEE